MSEPTHRPQDQESARAEALAWLSDQFRWETLLADLHELAERGERPDADSEAA